MTHKTRVSVTIDEVLAAKAGAAGINLSALAEEAIRFETRAEEMRRWAEENRAALQEKARLVEDEGLWSDGFRLF